MLKKILHTFIFLIAISFTFLSYAQTYTNGVLPDIADPHVLQHNGTYYLYGTHTGGSPEGIPVYTSNDLVNWQYRGWALRKEDSWGNHSFWAPEVIYRNGLFYMYYAVEEHLAVATSSSPLGPFRQNDQRPIHPNVKEIDAHVFIDDNGKKYFYFVRFTNGNEIWGAELNEDMKSINESTMRFIMGPSQAWENSPASPVARVNEGAFVIKHNGRYYMTFSANHFASPDYGVGYAVADNPLGPYYKYDGNPILQSNDRVHGAGHHSITRSPDGKQMFMVYHRHHSLNRIEPRRLAIDRMWFDGDILRVGGPSITPQQFPAGSPPSGQTAGIDSGGIYKLIAEHSGKALEVISSQMQDGANVQQWEDNSARTQQWRVDWMGNEYYKLTNINSGKCLDVDAMSLDEARNIHQWHDNGSDAQRWKIVPLNNGNFKLLAKYSGFALDVAGAGMNNGANIIQWPDGGSKGVAQHWNFVKVGGGNPTVRLQSSNFPNSYVRHFNYRARINSDISPKEDAMFNVVPGLAGAGISLESVNFPGHFLRHQNSNLYIHVNDGSNLFHADATFYEVPGLANNAASSFQSYNFPDRYIRHRDGWLRIDSINSEAERRDATFNKVNP